MAISITVPSVAELASLYRKAIAGDDRPLAFIAEAAMLHIAAAEAAFAEAVVLSEFASRAHP